jgi:hypothetical protein
MCRSRVTKMKRYAYFLEQITVVEGWGRRPPPRRRSRWRSWLPWVLVAGLILIPAVLNREQLLMRASSATAADPTRRTVDFTLVDVSSGSALDGLDVKFDDYPAIALGKGRYAARVPVDVELGAVQVPGFRPAPVPARRDAGPVISLVPDVLSGSVVDSAAGTPVARASVQVGELSTVTDAEGRFSLTGLPARPEVAVAAPGYQTTTISAGDQVELAVRLPQREIRAGYLTFYGVADAETRGRMLNMLNSGELNALVLDVKGDLGYLLYRSEVPAAQAIGANDILPLPDTESFVADLKRRGVYTIARIVVFKDDVLARNGSRIGLDVAVKDAATGGPWSDLERLAWVDPFREEVWAYNTALAEEAIRKGFDEVQFDYVRFPTDPGTGTQLDRARFSRVPDGENRPRAIAGFLGRARDAIHAAGGAISADVFGYVCWRDDDLGIGQHLETLAPLLDYISPMVYPSTFNGLPTQPSYVNSPAFPYEIVFLSLQRARERAAGSGVAIRPWLQYFDDYPWATGKRYGPPELAAQVKAARDLNLPGFLWWDPTNLYRHGPAARPS